MNLYEIYDSKAELWIELFKEETHASALRQFARLANDPNTMTGRFPGDYTLFHVGTWDRKTGDIKTEPKMSLGVAIELVEHQAGIPSLPFTKEEA